MLLGSTLQVQSACFSCWQCIVHCSNDIVHRTRQKEGQAPFLHAAIRIFAFLHVAIQHCFVTFDTMCPIPPAVRAVCLYACMMLQVWVQALQPCAIGGLGFHTAPRSHARQTLVDEHMVMHRHWAGTVRDCLEACMSLGSYMPLAEPHQTAPQTAVHVNLDTLLEHPPSHQKAMHFCAYFAGERCARAGAASSLSATTAACASQHWGCGICAVFPAFYGHVSCHA